MVGPHRLLCRERNLDLVSDRNARRLSNFLEYSFGKLKTPLRRSIDVTNGYLNVNMVLRVAITEEAVEFGEKTVAQLARITVVFGKQLTFQLWALPQTDLIARSRDGPVQGHLRVISRY